MKNLAKAIMKATSIVSGGKNEVIEHIAYGYRKNTTGEYVPNSYRSKFGWKNTYYQAALTTVEMVNNIEQFVNFENFLCLNRLNLK